MEPFGEEEAQLVFSCHNSLSLFDTESALGNDSASFEEKKEGSESERAEHM